MTENKPPKVEAPTSDSIKDAFWVVYMLFFLLGLVHMLPWSFFITAYDYWMHKFRDTSYDEVDSSHRTSLQTQFSPSLTISIHVSTVLSQLWALLYGRRYSVNMKLSVPLSILLLFFVIEAIFIVVDTDSWQTGFFTLTMIIVVVINVMSTIYGMAVYSILTTLPTEYLGGYLNGQGMASIFTSCLQILSLAVGISYETTALIYFWIGNSTVTLTLVIMLTVMKRNDFYRFHLRNHRDVDAKMPSIVEIGKIFKKIWPGSVIMIFWALTGFTVHTSITSLVVSEGEGNSDWNDVYFVPVITFLLPAVGEYVGRTVAVKMKISFGELWLVGFSALRMFVFVPLVMLCNAQPRQHLPVAFPHDYQYTIIMVAFSLTSGYLASMSSLIVPKLVPAEKLEDAFHVNILLIGIFEGIISFTGFVSVDLL